MCQHPASRQCFAMCQHVDSMPPAPQVPTCKHMSRVFGRAGEGVLLSQLLLRLLRLTDGATHHHHEPVVSVGHIHLSNLQQQPVTWIYREINLQDTTQQPTSTQATHAAKGCQISNRRGNKRGWPAATDCFLQRCVCKHKTKALTKSKVGHRPILSVNVWRLLCCLS